MFRSRALAGLFIAAVTVTSTAVGASSSAGAAPVPPRTFSCSGSLGEAFTQRTVTGTLTSADVPRNVSVTATATGTTDSFRRGSAASLGASPLHAGYTQWDITGPNPNGDLYYLHAPPVLPGGGGYFDADLEIQFAESANGGWQIPMFDCTVSGGNPSLATPPGPRGFTCTGSLGEAFTQRTVTGVLTRQNQPNQVSVVQTGTGVVDSFRRRSTSLGASWLHPGYAQWDVTGRNPNGDLYYLNIPPVLPRVGGFFDADLDIEFAGGANGSWQIPMFDCTVT